MKVLDKSYDKRINADCLLLKISLKDYYEIAKLIINNNKLQRKRVRSSNNIYNLLKRDLMIGCSVPPLDNILFLKLLATFLFIPPASWKTEKSSASSTSAHLYP